LLAFFLFLQPLILQRFTTDQFDMGKLVFFYLIAAAFLIGILIDRREDRLLRLDGVNISLVIFLTVSFISTLTSIHFPTSFFGKYQGYEGWLTLVALAVLFQVARTTASEERRLAGIAVAISISLVSFYGIIQRFGLDPLDWTEGLEWYQGRIFSTVGNPVMLGGLLALVLPVCLGLVLQKDRLDKFVGAGAFVLGGLCLYFTQSEGAWFGLWVGALATAYFYVCRPRARFAWIRWIAVCLAILTFISVVGLYIGQSPLIFSSSGQARMEFFRNAWRVFLERPLFGWGLDTFRLVSPKFRSLEFMQKWGYLYVSPTKVHNLILETLATLGIFGLLSFLLVIAAVVTKGFKQLKLADNGSMTPFVLGGVIAFLAYSMTGLTEIAISPTWWVLMGFLAAQPMSNERMPGKVSQKAVPIRPPLIVCTVLLALILTAASLSQAIADRNHLLAEGMGNLTVADGYYLRAEQFNPYNHGYYIDHGFRWIDQGIARENPEMWERGINLLQESVRSNRFEAETHLNLGIAYNRGGRHFNPEYFRAGTKSLKKAIEISPFLKAAHYQLSVAFLSLGRYEEALAESKITQKIESDYVPAYILQAGALYNLDRIDEAKRALQKAQRIDPGNQKVLDNLKFLEERSRDN